MPPSFSVSVGVPVTVTASFMVSVSTIVLPIPSSPLEGEATTFVTAGGGSIARPVSVVSAPDRLAALPAVSFTVAPFGRLAWVIASAETGLSFAPTV